jgi:hypothetical protein
MRRTHALQALFGLALLILLAPPARAGFLITNVGGDDTAASIQAAVDSFRAQLGDPNNANNPGPLFTGRREINWDGGGATTASPAGTPFEGFLNTRGARFETPGAGFLQTPLDAPELTSINPTYTDEFGFFSPVRIFTPVGSNITDVTFFIPGTNGVQEATVAGFGAVFTDVDTLGSTTMEFFNVNDTLLLTLEVEPGTAPQGSLSFAGAVADAGERIFRVRITSGNTALGPDDDRAGGIDVAAMDDFLYSEPLAIPEPSSLALITLGLLSSSALALRRKRPRNLRP